MVTFHLKDSDDREEKKKKLIGLLLFYWWTSLGVSLSKAYPTQYYCNLRARHPRSGCRSPGRLRCDSLLEIESPGRLRQVGLLRFGSLGRSRNVDLLRPLAWQIPSRFRHVNLLQTEFLGRSTCLGHLDWSWASLKSPV